MAFSNRLLQTDEHIQARAAAHWLPLLVPLSCFLILAIASVMPVYWAAAGHMKSPLPPLAIACFTIFPLVCVPMFCFQIALLTTRLVFTNKRFIATRFAPIPSSIQVPLSEVVGVAVHINSSGQTFGYGTVEVVFADKTIQKFRYMRDPEPFAAALAQVANLTAHSQPSPPDDNSS